MRKMTFDKFCISYVRRFYFIFQFKCTIYRAYHIYILAYYHKKHAIDTVDYIQLHTFRTLLITQQSLKSFVKFSNYIVTR